LGEFSLFSFFKFGRQEGVAGMAEARLGIVRPAPGLKVNEKGLLVRILGVDWFQS